MTDSLERFLQDLEFDVPAGLVDRARAAVVADNKWNLGAFGQLTPSKVPPSPRLLITRTQKESRFGAEVPPRRAMLIIAALLVVALVVTLVLAGRMLHKSPLVPADGGTSTDVTVWVNWGGQELSAFRDVITPFEQQTGINVHITTYGDLTDEIGRVIGGGADLPDISLGPTDPGQLKDWVSKGALKPIETALGSQFNAYIQNTYPALTTAPGGAADDPYIGIVGGKHYELMFQGDVKGLLWYNKKVFTGHGPKTFDELLAINPAQYGAQKIFCAGFESGPASGWPASDQLDNIIMRQSGEMLYTNWIEGKVKFSSPAIKLGYQTFLTEVSAANVYGGSSTVLATGFGNAGDPMFRNPPGCLFLEQAPFIARFFPNINAGADFDFFAHPSMGNSQYEKNVNGSYDSFVMYDNTPAARKLMQYMATVDAQQVWVNDVWAVGAIKSLTYSNPIFKRSADVVGGARNLLGAGADFMPSDLRRAFWQSMLIVTANPGSLDSELAHLDQVQAVAYHLRR